MTPAPVPDAEPLRLRVGEVAEIELANVATAGFRWEHAVEGPAEVVGVSRRRNPPPPGRAVGRAAAEHLVIEGRRVGRVVVHLSQRRAWESDVPPRATREITLEVIAGEPAGPPS